MRRSRRYQFPIGEGVGVDNPAQCVAEDARVVSVVVPPLKLFKVAVHVLAAHLVKRAYNGPFEQRPHAFDVVGVNVADHPFLFGVVDGFVARVIVRNAKVGLEIVGVDRFGLVLGRCGL